MISYKTLLWPAFLLCMINVAHAQLPDTSAAEITPAINNNQVKLGASLRPLRQIAGAPAAFYSYFWEFGDGSYSFEKEPVHIYKDTGDYDVRLYATNNYDDGKKPNTRPRRVRVASRSMLAENKQPSFFTGRGALEIKTNQMPKPGEDMVLLVGYRNPANNNITSRSGSIMLLYNEKQFNQNCFDVSDVRSYHQEKAIALESMLAWMPNNDMMQEGDSRQTGFITASASGYAPTADRLQRMQQIKQVMNGYRAHNIWRINNMQSGEERFMFVSINTLPDMIRDTNAVVTITGLFVPDDPLADMEQFNLELQVVASHDPNRMMLKKKKLSYRFTGKNRDNVYKIQFQNTGKGPAHKVAVTVTMPGLLNTSSLELTGMKPVCAWCRTLSGNQSCIDTIVTKDSVQFVFNNIYLPGMQQDGVSDPDSTIGFIKYRIHFGKKMRKIPFESRAAIVFDKNEPVYTNRSKGSFRKGVSPGIILGFGSIPGSIPANIAQQNYTLGFTVSEYAAWRSYFQWELHFQSYRSFEQFVVRRQGGDTLYNGAAYKVQYRDSYQKIKIVSVEAVPVEFRYNLASFASVGAGGLVAAELNRNTTNIVRAQVYNPNGNNTFPLEGNVGITHESFASVRGALFADAQLGKVRVGPVAGVRFAQFMHPGYRRLTFYLCWKF